MMTFLFISGGELVIVFLVVLLLFGSKKIPELARSLGKGMYEFKKATDEIKREFRENTQDLENEINNTSHSLNREMNSINDAFKEPSTPDDPYQHSGTEELGKDAIDKKNQDNDTEGDEKEITRE
ncbi:twin-arginine translocase TatA/TatE family subunit [Marinilabiliaceae bacterium JC017]|nr:twin-arginine translocase TatA/TatE family subunit [Marinilabiliaceae bacterium JC017]